MGIFERSLSLTRITFGVMRKDSEMLFFPVLAGIFSGLYTAALLVPSVLLPLSRGSHLRDDDPLVLVLAFASYLGLAFIATFFNVCVVYTTRVRLEGGDATFWQSIGFALSRAHQILLWSVVAATVGLLLNALHASARRSGVVGKILLSILHSLLASAWAITTIFVVPSMVYKGVGPFAAIADSMRTVKNTWGENLVRHFGLGLASFLASLIPIGIVVAGIFVAMQTPNLGVPLVGLGILGLIAVVILFQMANTIFTTALYHWAIHRKAPPGFDEELLSGALGTRG